MENQLVIRCVVSVLAGLWAAGGDSAARGGLVTWEFAGTTTMVRDINDVLGGALTVGSPFMGSFTFDPATPDGDGSASVAAFDNPVQDLSGNFGGATFTGPIFDISSMNIVDGAAGTNDVFTLSSSVYLNGQGLNFLLTMTDSSGTAFSSDALPAAPPDFGLFDSTSIRLLRQTNDLAIHGALTALTPEPSGLALLAVGAIAIVRRPRRR